MEILWKGNSPETLQKLCLSKKFLYQEIRWNYGIVAVFFSHTLLLMCNFAISFSLKSINPFFPNAPFLYPLKTLENRLYIHISSIMRQKGESQNDSYKKTKHTKFSEKNKHFWRPDTHTCVCLFLTSYKDCSFFE